MLFVQEEGHGEVTDLLLGVFVGRNEVYGLQMAKVDIPPEDVYVQELRIHQVSVRGALVVRP